MNNNVSKPLDRSQAPPLKSIDKLHIGAPKRFQLNNGIPIIAFEAPEQSVMYINLVFNAGKWHQDEPLIASFTSRLLREGTQNYSRQEIAEAIEFYGSNLRTQSRGYYAQVTLSCLSRYLPQMLPILKEILQAATFPQKELNTILNNSKQKLLVSREKNSVLAEEKFGELFFGGEHPYGYVVQESHYDQVNPEKLAAFYKKHYHPGNCTIYMAGKLPENSIDLLNEYIGGNDWKIQGKTLDRPYLPLACKATEKVHYISKPGSVQAAIRIGMPLFNKTHKDFPAFFVLNTILGGYFGARLVKNLRMEKGLTYGIYSTITSLLRYGYFYIGTEVNGDQWETAIKEIIFEINRLKKDLVSQDELQLVRNYLLGNLLSSLDGAFNLASTLQGAYAYNMDANFFHQLTETIKSVSPEELQALAIKYFDTDKMLKIVVGK